MAQRGLSFSVSEDRLLCQVYVDIFQDPIIENNQGLNRFWNRIEEKYNESKSEASAHHTTRSLQSRMQTIKKAVRKLNGCIWQVELRHLSGASEMDILNEAKILLMEDPAFRKGFKFDHVWNIIKDFEKFNNNVVTPSRLPKKHGVNYLSSDSENPTPDSPSVGSIGISNFNIASDDIEGSSGRPIGVNKAKGKKKTDQSIVDAVAIIHEDNQQLVEVMKRNVAIKERREEDKILLTDLTTISDPNVRAYFEARRIEILQRRGHLPPPPDSPSNTF